MFLLNQNVLMNKFQNKGFSQVSFMTFSCEIPRIVRELEIYHYTHYAYFLPSICRVLMCVNTHMHISPFKRKNVAVRANCACATVISFRNPYQKNGMKQKTLVHNS